MTDKQSDKAGIATPRTDAQQDAEDRFDGSVTADFARQLERELNDALAATSSRRGVEPGQPAIGAPSLVGSAELHRLDPRLERLADRAARGSLNPNEVVDAAARLGAALLKATSARSAIPHRKCWRCGNPMDTKRPFCPNSEISAPCMSVEDGPPVPPKHRPWA